VNPPMAVVGFIVVVIVMREHRRSSASELTQTS
jgi:hypothetical protein